MKKLLALFLTVLVLLPLGMFPTTAEISDWSCLAAKYSSATHKIIAPASSGHRIKTEGFKFDVKNDEFYVESPSYNEFNGVFPVAVLSTNRALPLDTMTIDMDLYDFDFELNDYNISNQITFIYSDKPVTQIAGGFDGEEYTNGLYNAVKTLSGGLRNILEPDAKGLCVTLSNINPDSRQKMTATRVDIIYYDGSFADADANLGYRWTFTKNPGNNINPYGGTETKNTPYEAADLNDGLFIKLLPDDELGYVIEINGKRYYGEDAGYTNHDLTDIDLNALKDIPEGYVTVGIVGNATKNEPERTFGFKLSGVHGKAPVTVWDTLNQTETVPVPNDVKESHWYYSSVLHVMDKHYMNGVGNNRFSPNLNLTREQFVQILANMSGVDTTEYKDVESGMGDVPTGKWYSGAVAWAVEKGYIAGISEGVFGTGMPIKRAELARLLYLFAEKNGKQTEEKADLSSYADFDKVQDWMADGLGWAVHHNIITSMKDDALVLAPTATATRAQCARMLTVYDEVPVKSQDPTPEPDIPDPDPVVPDTDPLGVDKEKLKEFLKNGGTETEDEVYSLNLLCLTLVYNEWEGLLYAEYVDGMGYPPHYFSYEFGTDEVNIHGPGNVMPPIEHNGELDLIKPYMRVMATAEMTAEGIINAPNEYKLELERMYEELMELLEMLDILK